MKKLITVLCLSSLPLFAHASTFSLKSADFADNGVMKKAFGGNDKNNLACSGENLSPALNWANPPVGTQSYVLLLTDPAGAKGLGVTHMLAYNIDATRNKFQQGELSKGGDFSYGTNTPGTQNYYGPCPPAGAGYHHYNFVLVATDLAKGSLPAGLSHTELVAKLKGHALGSASLVGRLGN